MAISKDMTIYEQTVAITSSYLGPAAERFVDRQIQNHLAKPPTELTATDLIKLIDWIRIAVSFLTEDSSIIEDYIAELKQLSINAGEGRGGAA